MCIIGWAALSLGSIAYANPSPELMCETPQEFVSPTEHLRAVSLDLPGSSPHWPSCRRSRRREASRLR